MYIQGLSGILFPELLQITFIILKLMNIITWNWLWVLSPAWITGIIIIISVIISKMNNRKV